MESSLIKLITQESSMHGLRHITDQRRNKLSRLFWFCVVCASISLLFFSGYNVYLKWNVEPEIGLRVNQKSMSDLPFPAVTICSPIFARDNLSNFTKAADAFKAKNPVKFSSSEQNYFAANSHGCAPSVMKFVMETCKNRTDFNTMKLINESSLYPDEMLKACNFRGLPFACSRLFTRILTDYGYCFTYNMLDHSQLFNEGIISPEFDSFKKTTGQFGSNLSIQWTLDESYTVGKNHTILFPVRAIKNNILSLYAYLNETDSTNVCQGTGKVFPIILHMPNETPTPFHEELYFEFGRRKVVTLMIKKYKSTEDLRKYEPEKRGCYFEGERQLKFYKSYTKSHCDFECMTNYTLKECGCVKFSMPRTKGTPVCDIDRGDCYYNAMLQWPKDEENSHRPCNCLETCSNIKYSVMYSRDSPLSDYTGPSPLMDMKRCELDEFFKGL
jgi:amiloride-sensitive sodium channel